MASALENFGILAVSGYSRPYDSWVARLAFLAVFTVVLIKNFCRSPFM